MCIKAGYLGQELTTCGSREENTVCEDACWDSMELCNRIPDTLSERKNCLVWLVEGGDPSSCECSLDSSTWCGQVESNKIKLMFLQQLTFIYIKSVDHICFFFFC